MGYVVELQFWGDGVFPIPRRFYWSEDIPDKCAIWELDGNTVVKIWDAETGYQLRDTQ